MKKIVLALLIVSLFALPANAVLRAERIGPVGMQSNQISSDMTEIEDALQTFAAAHPDATVDSVDIVPHTASGSYDIFIMYRE
jgi:hypothetical protein